MLSAKRPFPSSLQDASTRVEQWRGRLVKSIHQSSTVATYLLARLACDLVRMASQPDNSQFDAMAQSWLPALQFALERLESPRGVAALHWQPAEGLLRDDALVRRACQVLAEMRNYALVRDALSCYQWGGLDLDEISTVEFEFRDTPDWNGAVDYSENRMRMDLKNEVVRQALASGRNPIRATLELALWFPPSLDVGGINAEKLLLAWWSLYQHLFPSWLACEAMAVWRRPVLYEVLRDSDLSENELGRFVDLLTFSPGKPALTLFHRPLVPISDSEFLVLVPGILGFDPACCIPGLAVHCGAGYRKFGAAADAYLLNKLRTHYAAPGVTVRARMRYSYGSDSGDLDLVVHEAQTDRLLIAMAKAFIPPKSSEEVVRQNKSLAEALAQVERARLWVDAGGREQIFRRLQIGRHSGRTTVDYAVIGNGFSGSDPVHRTGAASLADVMYLLQPRLRGGSIFGAIAEYKSELAKHAADAPSKHRTVEVTLGDVAFRFSVYDFTSAAEGQLQWPLNK